MTRNASIDIARGIGILLVVLGHSWFANTQGHAYFRNSLGTFRMPLFFFVSGSVFEHRRQPGRFCPDADSRLDQTVFRSFADGLVSFSAKRLISGQSEMADVFRSLATIFYGTGPVLSIAPLWFLPVLLLSSFCCYLLARVVPKESPQRRAWLMGTAVILLAVWVPRIDSFWGLSGETGLREFLKPCLGCPGASTSCRSAWPS